MKTTQTLVLLVVCCATGQAWAQEPAAYPQQTLTYPPQPQVTNTLQYPSMAQPTWQFPQQAYRPAAQVYPYYAYPGYGYYPYTQAYNPYAYRYPFYPQYANPYAAMLRPPTPQPPPKKKETKPWGDTRYIWPDFYTDFTGDAWDKMINAPYDMGYMPGGWRFPSFSSPDPVTVADAIANQVPPFAEEAGNMIPFEDVGNLRPF